MRRCSHMQPRFRRRESLVFILDQAGPSGVFGVFEDDGETGYLYIYDPGERGIMADCHVYDRTESTNVRKGDVALTWDGPRCKVLIHGVEAGALDAPNT
jgi:hypothetical protein